METKFKLISSLEKIFFDYPEEVKEHTRGTMLKNEIYSFQLLGWVKHEALRRMLCRIEVESELAPYIEVKQVGYVPAILPSIRIGDDDDYITKTPGLFPDPLQPLVDHKIELMSFQARAIWISIEPKGQVTGTYPITLKVYDPKDELLTEQTFTIEIIDAELPELDIYNTGWLYSDCIMEMHQVKFLSDAYWALLGKYLETYVKFGHNMILTPLFTPPLNTAIGKERPTNQLVEVTLTKGKYTFGFEQLHKWIQMCLRYGIRYFEMNHLFTQWGAKAAPKVMATVDGEYKRLFGWETDATGEEYTTFLHRFLEALLPFLEEEGILDQCFFHISDEPSDRHEEQYVAAKKILKDYVKEDRLFDALSHYSFYEKGIINQPVVLNQDIQEFLDHDAKNLWTYYCMASRKGVANRFVSMPAYRNRILGYQMYKYNIIGFLHWGYNFWFNNLSEYLVNPFLDSCSGGQYQSGDGYVVYPIGQDGEVVCSTRLYVFNETLQDLRALRLLEQLEGRDAVLSLLDQVVGFAEYPRDNEYILALREEINRRIKEKQK